MVMRPSYIPALYIGRRPRVAVPLRSGAVSSDLSKAFLPAIGRNFPNAEHTVDKFHVKQIVTKAEDKSRLFLGRRLFIIPDSRLTESQRSQLAELSRQYPRTWKGRMMLEDLAEFYRSKTLEEAEVPVFVDETLRS